MSDAVTQLRTPITVTGGTAGSDYTISGDYGTRITFSTPGTYTVTYGKDGLGTVDVVYTVTSAS